MIFCSSCVGLSVALAGCGSRRALAVWPRNDHDASRIVRDAASSRQDFQQRRRSDHLVNHRCLYGAHDGDRLAGLIFDEYRNLRMRNESVLNKQLLELRFQLERTQAGHANFPGYQRDS